MTFAKLSYEAPASTVFEVRLEQCILELSGGANYADTAGGVSGDDSYNDYGNL